MIRIDEIYNHTFWPFVQQHIPLTRLFYCDPFGHTQPQNLYNFGSDIQEINYVYCHDQEPLYPDVHQPLFDDVVTRNTDLDHGQGSKHAAIIVSETCSDNVTQICSKYNWTPYYYFFHGWAALDWYRGYHRSFLMPAPHKRKPQRVYFSANRITGGKREHRMLMLYHLARQGCLDAHISFPATCPDTGEGILQIASKFQQRYPDIASVVGCLDLPWHLPGETGHPMHSCWLSQFDAVADCMVYVVTETVAMQRRWHLTEKTFKPICMQMPFVLVSTQGSLRYLRSYGFQTFGAFWDESYDDEQDDFERFAKIAQVIRYLHDMSVVQRQRLFQDIIPVLQHNHHHFYHGGFERTLWTELETMLQAVAKDCNDAA